MRTVTVSVPEMADQRAIRIVTNAALDEVIGRYDGTQHDYEVDLAKRVVLYHEGPGLRSRDYQRKIEARIQEVGLDARVVEVRLNPPVPVPTANGPFQAWPDRFTAVISVPAMTGAMDANIVVDAIAYARLGKDDPRVWARRHPRSVVVTYDSLCRISGEQYPSQPG